VWETFRFNPPSKRRKHIEGGFVIPWDMGGLIFPWPDVQKTALSLKGGNKDLMKKGGATERTAKNREETPGTPRIGNRRKRGTAKPN